MAKYKKKPVVIEAFQWTGDYKQKEDSVWIIEAFEQGVAYFKHLGTEKVELVIKTLEGDHIASRGDYIIQGVQGELYPCKPDIFEQTYEKV